MSAIDFPASPTVGQIFTPANGAVYQWTGTLWKMTGVSGGVATPTYDSTSSLMTDTGTWASANGTTPMQITQGQQVFSRSFTAVDATHPIEVDITLLMGNGGQVIAAGGGLFIDGVATSVAQASAIFNTAWFNSPIRIYWQGVLSAGAHTFAVRFGANAANGYLNGNNGVGVGGGSARSTMVIREIGVGPIGPQGPPGAAQVLLQTLNKRISGTALFTGTYATGSGAAPTSAGGVLVQSVSITPMSATSVLEVEATIKGTSSGTDHYMLALFNGTTLLDVQTQFMTGATGYQYGLMLRTAFASPGTTAQTLNLRLGSNGGNGFQLNQANNNSTPFVPQVGESSWLRVHEVAGAIT